MAIGTALMLGSAIAKAVQGGTELAKQGAANKTIMSSEEEERLRRLRARRANGGLGLSDDATQTLQRRVLAPVQGAEREARLTEGRALAGADVGGGAFFRQEQAAIGERARARIAGADALAAADTEARARQEEEIIDLAHKQELEAAAKAQAKSDKLSFGAGLFSEAINMASDVGAAKLLEKAALGGEKEKELGGLLGTGGLFNISEYF